MTKVMIHIKDGNIFFDCANHANDREKCAMVSTLCNVLIVACRRANISSVTEEDAHVNIEIDKASPALTEIFRTVREVFYELEDQFPFQVKIY